MLLLATDQMWKPPDRNEQLQNWLYEDTMCCLHGNIQQSKSKNYYAENLRKKEGQGRKKEKEKNIIENKGRRHEETEKLKRGGKQ